MTEQRPARRPATEPRPARSSATAPGVHELDAVAARRGSLPLGLGQHGDVAGAPTGTGAPPVADGPTAPATPVQACSINHRATVHAPDGTHDDRTTIGVCETIAFDVGGRAMDWSADSGWPSARSGRATFEWAAPERPGTSTITATDPATGGSCSLGMEVIAPSGTRLNNVAEHTYPIGSAGAGMDLSVGVLPRSVNFGWIAIHEDSGAALDVSGYFAARPAADLRHNATPGYARIGWDNMLAPNAAGDPQGDQAGTRPGTLPPPWSAGSYRWRIPTRYRCSNSTHDGFVFTYVPQRFAMENDGTMIVTKGTERVERTP